jgi:hypothetical protein
MFLQNVGWFSMDYTALHPQLFVVLYTADVLRCPIYKCLRRQNVVEVTFI